MQIIAGTAETLSAKLLSEMAHYRYRVFVEQLGWKLQVRGRMELDRFDRPDTCYLVARDAKCEIIGMARLLPTHRPYLLASVFPQLLGDTPAPRTPLVWELSRFAAVDLRARKGVRQDPYGSSVALELLDAAMQFVARQGAQRLVSASPLGIERILRRAGLKARRAGPPVLVDGQRLFACFMEVDKAWRPGADHAAAVAAASAC